MRLVWLCSFVALLILAPGAGALPNPAAVYCRELGYEYTITSGEEGDMGMCRLPDTECDAWEFLRGMCGREHSYCARHGYGIRPAESGEAVCLVSRFSVKRDGSLVTEEIPVGEMMDLSRGCEESKPKSNSQPVMASSSGPKISAYNASEFSYWDWRDPPLGTVYNQGNFTFFDNASGWLTSVKDQGTCGSCWSFSSVGIIESKYEINENEPRLNPDLSEEYLVSDCHQHEYQDCCGGYMEVALNFITYEGVTDESCLPYVDESGCTCSSPHVCSGSCNYNTGSNCSDAGCSGRCNDYSERLWEIGGANYSSFWTGFTDEELEQWIIDRGPLTIGIYMVDNPDTRGFINCGGGGTSGHAVILAGYNDTGNDSTSYWILKNSWGNTWAQDGYFKIRFNDNCNVGDEVHYVNMTYPPEFKPNIWLNGPVEGNETSFQTVGFNFTTGNRNSSTSTCDLIVNGEVANTTQSTNGTPVEIRYNFSPGNYGWSIKCWEDDLGTVNTTETRNITVMIPPGITTSGPGNETYEILPLDLNLSTNESANWCGWNLDDTANDTLSGSGTTWYGSISPTEGLHRLYVYCNDSAGNMGSSSVYFTYNPEEPRYHDNSTNSTVAGSLVEFSLVWTDNTGLDTYKLGLDNCTGSFANITGTFSGIGNWSNVTVTVNSSLGCTIRWKFHANDTSGLWNVSETYSFITTDNASPQIYGTGIVPSKVRPGWNVTVMTRVTDDNEIDSVWGKLYNTSWGKVYEDNFTNSSDEWSLTFNSTGLNEGLYYFNITAADSSGNNATEWAGNLTVNQISGALYTFTNVSLTTNGNSTIISEDNFTIDINTTQDVSSGISISMYSKNPGPDAQNLAGAGNFLEIETGNSLSESLMLAVIKLSYDDQDAIDADLDESSLGIYWYNESSGTWTLKPGGVNTTGNYVWGNTTHFSFYGIFGPTTTTTTTTLGRSRGSGSTIITTTSTSTTTSTTTTSTTLRSPLSGHTTSQEKNTTIEENQKQENSPNIPAIIVFLVALIFVLGKKKVKHNTGPRISSDAVPLKIRQILSRPDEYLDKRVVLEDKLKPVKFLPRKNMTLYTISDGTGKLRGFSRKSWYEGKGILEGTVKKDGKGYYLEF